MDNTPNPRVLRRELMARRDAALAAGDIAQYQSLTTQIVHVDRDVLAALRDVLTPRTCGTCRHAKFYTTNSEYGMCRGDSIAIGRDITESDGCIKGWQAREGEGGTR